jgi:SHS2 domain-containing protein
MIMPSAASLGSAKNDSMNADQNARQFPEAGSKPVKKKGGAAAFRLLEHTADMGIEAQAASCEELFVQAAKGLLAVLAGSADSMIPIRVLTLEVAAGDVEELLVVWLNELLYLIQTKGMWPQDITLTDMKPGSLEARLAVVPLTGDPQREIKAATYHHLMVSCRQGLWRARVYLDL